jgi:hypothetical protein
MHLYISYYVISPGKTDDIDLFNFMKRHPFEEKVFIIRVVQYRILALTPSKNQGLCFNPLNLLKMSRSKIISKNHTAEMQHSQRCQRLCWTQIMYAENKLMFKDKRMQERS